MEVYHYQIAAVAAVVYYSMFCMFTRENSGSAKTVGGVIFAAVIYLSYIHFFNPNYQVNVPVYEYIFHYRFIGTIGISAGVLLYALRNWGLFYKITSLFRLPRFNFGEKRAQRKREKEYKKQEIERSDRERTQLEIERERTRQKELDAQMQRDRLEHTRPEKAKALEQIVNKIDEI